MIGYVESVNSDKTINLRIAGLLIPHISIKFKPYIGQRVLLQGPVVIPIESFTNSNNIQIDIGINYILSENVTPPPIPALIIPAANPTEIYILTSTPVSTFRKSELDLNLVTEGGDTTLPNPLPYHIHQQDQDERYDPETGIEFNPAPPNISELIAYVPRDKDFIDGYVPNSIIDDELVRDKDRDPGTPFPQRHARAIFARKELSVSPEQNNIAYIRSFLSEESFHVLLKEESSLGVIIDPTKVRAVFQDKHTAYHGNFLRAKLVKPSSFVEALDETTDLPWINQYRFLEGFIYRFGFFGTHPSSYFTLVHADPAFHENYIDFTLEQDFEDFINGVSIYQPTAQVERLYPGYITINRLMNLQPVADQTYAFPATFKTMLIGEKNIDGATLPISLEGPISNDRNIFFRLNYFDNLVPEEPFYAREDSSTPDSSRSVTYEPFAYALKNTQELDIGTWIQSWSMHLYSYSTGDKFEGGPAVRTDPFTSDFFAWVPNTFMQYYYDNPDCPLHEIRRGLPLSVWLYVTDWTGVRHSSVHLGYQYFMVPAFSKSVDPSTVSNRYFYPEADMVGSDNFFTISGLDYPCFLPNKINPVEPTIESSLSFTLDNFRNVANKNSDGSTDPYFERGKLFFVTNKDSTITAGGVGLSFYPDPGVYGIGSVDHPFYIYTRLSTPGSRTHSEIYARVWVSLSGTFQEVVPFNMEFLPYDPYYAPNFPQPLNCLSITDPFFGVTWPLSFYKVCVKHQTCLHNRLAWLADPLPDPDDPFGSDPGNPLVIAPTNSVDPATGIHKATVTVGSFKLKTSLSGDPPSAEVNAPNMGCTLKFESGDTTGAQMQFSNDPFFTTFSTTSLNVLMDSQGNNPLFYMRYKRGPNEDRFAWTLGVDTSSQGSPAYPTVLGPSGFGVPPRGKSRFVRAYIGSKLMYGEGTAPYEFPPGSGEYWNKGQAIHFKITGILGILGFPGVVNWDDKGKFVIPAIRYHLPGTPPSPWTSPVTINFTMTPVAVTPPLVPGLTYNKIGGTGTYVTGMDMSAFSTIGEGQTFNFALTYRQRIWDQFFYDQNKAAAQPTGERFISNIFLTEGFNFPSSTGDRILAWLELYEYFA